MNVTLNTTLTHEGVKLTTNSGHIIGIVRPQVQDFRVTTWQFCPTFPIGQAAPVRQSRTAAEFDALAYHAETLNA